MDADALLRGAAIGLAVAAPVGPVGLLCVRRTLSGGAAIGFASGLGAATADAAYAAMAALGTGAAIRFLDEHATAIGVAGGALLVALAASGLRRPAAEHAAPAADARGLASAFGSVLVLTLANPATILSFVAIFAGIGAAAATAPMSLAIGVFSGSAAWWLFLALATAMLGRGIGARGRRAIDVAAALFLAGFGAWTIVSALR
ncbi:MAG: LysE family transporter [Alphaproteobacteria bacterium]